MRKVRPPGQDKVDWVFTFTAAAYDLVRLCGLAAAPKINHVGTWTEAKPPRPERPVWGPPERT